MELERQIAEQQTRVEEKIAIVERLSEERAREYEETLAKRDAAIASLNSTVGRVQLAAEEAVAKANTESADSCSKRVKKYASLLSSGAEVAGRCSTELRAKDDALAACVRSYKDLEIVYDSTK